jgi:hypothetical protein
MRQVASPPVVTRAHAVARLACQSSLLTQTLSNRRSASCSGTGTRNDRLVKNSQRCVCSHSPVALAAAWRSRISSSGSLKDRHTGRTSGIPRRLASGSRIECEPLSVADEDLGRQTGDGSHSALATFPGIKRREACLPEVSSPSAGSEGNEGSSCAVSCCLREHVEQRSRAVLTQQASHTETLCRPYRTLDRLPISGLA